MKENKEKDTKKENEVDNPLHFIKNHTIKPLSHRKQTQCEKENDEKRTSKPKNAHRKTMKNTLFIYKIQNIIEKEY